MFALPQLRLLFPSAQPAHLNAFAGQGAALFRQAALDVSPQRCHFFLAQTGHESDGLRARAEDLNYSAARLMQVWPSRFPDMRSAAPYARNPEALAERVYGSRMGNREPGDGYRYRGRGYIQLTGRDAYREVGMRAGLDLEADPELANHPDHALAVACGYWEWKRLNTVCDSGDYTALTRRINGGLIGLQDRFAWLQRAQHFIPWEIPGKPSVITLRAVQQALKDRGLYAGSIDGIIGRQSLAAIATLRAEAGLPLRGNIDAALLKELGVAG